MIMKIVITGGSGFIGTNLIERFMSENYDVCNLDFNEPKISEHKSIWKNVDLRVYADVERELISFNPDYIVHLAARTDLDGKTIAEYDSNTLAVENLLRAIKKLDNLKKIIITSSMLVCKVGYIPKSDRDFAPSTLYGESKVITENLVWKTQPDCDWAIVRPTSIWGPWFGAPYRNFFDMVIARKYFHIGNKGCTKTYGCNGVQREHNKKLNNGLPILHKVPPKRDYGRYFCIMAEKGGTSHGGLTEKLSPFFHAKKQEVNAYGR